jgi:hypothetical protein
MKFPFAEIVILPWPLVRWVLIVLSGPTRNSWKARPHLPDGFGPSRQNCEFVCRAIHAAT